MAVKLSWRRLGRSVVGLPICLVLLVLGGVGRLLDYVATAGFDSLMDWTYGDDSWRRDEAAND